ncbi:4Fe-4S binding protein [Eggerthella sp. NSJ-70]|uniref:4Fe-4S binding protein n=1 Tax=Eggerthella hominis TaxID=2763043 RepID=A0ABR7BQ69_9ACTN|nr:4Fe-4S binding protein [Eggerthella hominis]MBC5583215.1 4Fe-4S binding protein [Eggerthella hominis]
MRRPVNVRRLRAATACLFIALVVVGLATNAAFGTLSSFGVGDLALICPLGSLEVLLASRTFVPLAFTSLICVAIASMLLGRVFCGWICPISLTRSLRAKEKREDAPGTRTAEELPGADTAIAPSRFHSDGIGAPRFDSRFAVLLGALASSAVFGFPVFCLICPVGLTFGLVIGVWRLVGYNEPSWLLVFSAAFLMLELTVLRSWCGKFCPLGALMSLASTLNRRLRPRVDAGACLRTTKGVACTRCKDACTEMINLHDRTDSAPMADCTKCGECASACPAHAIRFLEGAGPRNAPDGHRPE